MGLLNINNRADTVVPGFKKQFNKIGDILRNIGLYRVILNLGFFFELHKLELKKSRLSKNCQIKLVWQLIYHIILRVPLTFH